MYVSIPETAWSSRAHNGVHFFIISPTFQLCLLWTGLIWECVCQYGTPVVTQVNNSTFSSMFGELQLQERGKKSVKAEQAENLQQSRYPIYAQILIEVFDEHDEIIDGTLSRVSDYPPVFRVVVSVV